MSTTKEQELPSLSPFAGRMLSAIVRLMKENEPHPCGGFTTDDMQWRMGTAFTPQEALDEAIEELAKAKLIRFSGCDEEYEIGVCYELAVTGKRTL
jgi:hypothetical protein